VKRLCVLVALGLALAAVPQAGTAVHARDPQLRAAIALVKRKGYTPDPRTWSRGSTLNVLIGTFTRSADGYNKRAFFFVKHRGYIGTDTRNPSLSMFLLWADDTTGAIMYILYRRNDPNCCPTGGGKIVRYRWTGRRLRPLDRIPTANANAPLHR
jgi:LppP/LprE lipoprotein